MFDTLARVASPDLSNLYLIDDDELSRELIALTLEAAGCPTRSFPSGEAALEALGQPFPGVVITDLHMPGICGNPLAEKLRSVTGPETLLMAISGRQPEPEAISAFDGFLLKPFTTEQLLNALHAPEKPSVASPAAPKPVGPPILDETTLRKLAASMKPDQLRQLYQLTLLDATRRAGLLQAAADAGDETTFIREAHSLQGGCGMIGAMELRSIALAMEYGGLPAATLLPQIAVAADRLQRMLEALPEL